MVARMSAGKVSFQSIVVLGVLGVVLGGCSAGRGKMRGAPASQPAKQAAVDPMRLMRDSLARCEALGGYEIVFHRQERRGLLAKLGDWEDIRVCFRKQPRSVKMAWVNPESEYVEAAYVEGVNDGKVTVLARKGLFGLPASPISVPPEMAVQMGKSLRPISDFGLAAMVRRTLVQVEEAGKLGGASVTYEGEVTLEGSRSRAHHVAIRYPEGLSATARQDLYINVETGYPVGVRLWQANGDLRAVYLYETPAVGRRGTTSLRWGRSRPWPKGTDSTVTVQGPGGST